MKSDRLTIALKPNYHFAMQAHPQEIRWIYMLCAVLVLLILLAFVAYSYLKRWMNQTDESVQIGFSLSDLREMHRQGKMSDEEFELTRAKMVASAKRAMDRMPEVLPRRAGKAQTNIRTDNDAPPPPAA